MHKTLALATLLFLGCGEQPLDALAELHDPVVDSGAVDPAAIAGSYQLGEAAPAGDDLVYLQLTADGRFAWTRCYDAACKSPLREDGTYQLTRAASGRQYLRFYQRGAAGDPTPHLSSTYACAAGPARSLRLRRASTRLTFVVRAMTEQEPCASSGGAWNPASHSCDCGAGWPVAYSPGAGGCWHSPPVSEMACDATRGSWTDDDAGLIGTYCDCGFARHLTEAGCADNQF